MNLLKKAHEIWAQHIECLEKEDICLVDATCGNGHDALFLSSLPHNYLHLIDIQKDAIESTKRKVSKAHFHLRSHEDLSFISEPIHLITYNLGYLPGSDKSIITRPDTTLKSLQSALDQLAPNGMISLVVYKGHDGGMDEYNCIQHFINNLPEPCICKHITNPLKPAAPELFIIN